MLAYYQKQYEKYKGLIGRTITDVVPVFYGSHFQHFIFVFDDCSVMEEYDGEYGGNNTVLYLSIADYRNKNRGCSIGEPEEGDINGN